MSFGASAQQRDLDDLVQAARENDASETFRAARDIIRERNRGAGSVLMPTQVEQGVCVECQNLLSLTDQVQKILVEMNEAPQEVEELAVVSQYIRYISDTGQPDCLNYLDPKWSDEFRAPDLDSALVIYSGEFDLNRLESWRISGGSLPGDSNPGDTIFLRGRGDDKDLFIRVDQPSDIDAAPRVTVYRLIFVPDDLAETPQQVRERDNPLPDLDGAGTSWRPNWERDGAYDGSLDLSPSQTTRIHIGPILEMRDYLPRSLSILDFSTVQPLNEENNLEVRGEVSTRRQEARFAIVGRHGQGERVWLKVREDGRYEVGMPYTFKYDGVPIQGNLMANQNGAGASLSYRNNGITSTEARYFNQDGRSSYELDHRRKITEKATMTFRIAREDGKESAWLLFRYALD